MAAPPYAPPSPPRRRHRGGIAGPVVLIFIGVVFLLQNLGYLPPNAWVNLWRLWPLVLVLGGLELIFGGRLPWLVLATLAVAIMVAGVLTLGPSTSVTNPPAIVQTYTTDLAGASQATVTLRFGAGVLTLGPLVQSGTPTTTLASMQYAGPSGSAPVPQYGVSGTTGDLAVDASTHGGTPGFVPFVGDRTQTMHLDVQLSTAVPITSLSVQTGAADAQLDLGSLRLNNLDVQVGAATTWIRLPETGRTTARVKGGAATITLEIPQGVAAQIHHSGGLSTFTIDQARFPQVDEGLYRSPDYDTASNRVDLDIETGVTTIRVQ